MSFAVNLQVCSTCVVVNFRQLWWVNSSLYTLVTSFHSVIYATFGSQSNMPFSVGPAPIRLFIAQKIIHCKFTFLLRSWTQFFSVVVPPWVKYLQCVWTSKGLYIPSSEGWTSCRLSYQNGSLSFGASAGCSVVYSSELVWERICHTGWAYWGRWFRFGPMLCSFMPVHSSEVLCWPTQGWTWKTPTQLCMR